MVVGTGVVRQAGKRNGLFRIAGQLETLGGCAGSGAQVLKGCVSYPAKLSAAPHAQPSRNEKDATPLQATFADAQNAVEDMENVVRMLQYVIDRYGDRFPADDGVADGDDLGDLNTLLTDAQTALNNARTAMNTVDASDLEDVNNSSPTNADSVESVVRTVQQAATSAAGAASAFQTILDNVNTQVTGVPNANQLLADPAKAGDIVYGDMTAQVHNIASLRTFEPVADRDCLGSG